MNITPEQLRAAADRLREAADETEMNTSPVRQTAFLVTAQFCEHVARQIEREERG